MPALKAILPIMVITTIFYMSCDAGTTELELSKSQLDAQPNETSLFKDSECQDFSADFWTWNDSVQKITKGKGCQRNPIWNPDSETIVYEQDGEIYLVNIEGGEPVHLASGYNPTFSPDGSEVVFLNAGSATSEFSNSEIKGIEALVVNVNEREIRSIGKLESDAIALSSSVVMGDKPGVWDSSGKWLAFHVIQTARMVDALAIWDIENNDLKIIDSFVPISDMSWSPNSNELVVAAYPQLEDENHQTDIWTINVDTGEHHKLTYTDKANEFIPIWSPDGSTIAFGRYVFEGYQAGPFHSLMDGTDIWIMEPDGSSPRLLVKRTSVYGATSIEPFEWNPSGSKIVYFEWGLRREGQYNARLGMDLWGIGKSYHDNSWNIESHLLSTPCCNGWIGNLRWSPDGSKIAFEWAPTAMWIEEYPMGMLLRIDTEESDQHIYVFDAAQCE